MVATRTLRFVALTAAALSLSALPFPAQARTAVEPVAAPAADPVPSAADPTPEQVAAMRFGYSTPTDNGRLTTAQAVDRQIANYGHGVVRRFYSRPPAPWSTINSQSRGLPHFISFKMTPQSVNAGQYDSMLLSWFRAAPTARKTWWSYMPEPEDDIEDGQYTAAAFRSAYARIAGLEHRANNSQLISTLTLMAYTAGSCGRGSTRNIMNYWPGSSNVDQIAFDCSNRGVNVGEYTPPSQMLAGARAAAQRLGKPWGLGEIESQLLRGDDGTRRAAWLMAVGRYVAANGGTFACYFDEKRDVDFRLTDAKSKQAWRSIVIDQTP